MATNNAIALTATGLVGYNGAGVFSASNITQSNVVIGGGSSSTYAGVAPPNNTGTPLISQVGAGQAPVFGACKVIGGGTGLTTLTTNQLMASGTTSTGNMQQISSGNSGQFLVSNGSSSLPSFQSPSGVFIWNDIAVNTNVVVSNGYFCVASITATLPASPSEGDSITIYNDFGASVVIQANTGQIIRIAGSVSSTAGTATSAARGDSVTLIFRSSNSAWNSPSSQGAWVLV